MPRKTTFLPQKFPKLNNNNFILVSFLWFQKYKENGNTKKGIQRVVGKHDGNQT